MDPNRAGNGDFLKLRLAMSTNTQSRDVSLFRIARRSSLLWSGERSGEGIRSLFGLPISDIPLHAAVSGMIFAALEGKRERIVFVNAHVVNVAATNRAYAKTIASADRLFADGSGMALAARLCGGPLVDNVNGTDLFPLLCEAASEAGVTLFLLGGQPGVTEAVAALLDMRRLRHVIAGTHHGYVRRRGAEQREAIQAINASGASIVLIGMGVPVQDIWIERNAHALHAPVIAGVGGLFDFFAGNVRRAPVALRGAGLEWAWRLLQEPRRMWRRYLVGNVAFLGRAVWHAATAVSVRTRRGG